MREVEGWRYHVFYKVGLSFVRADEGVRCEALVVGGGGGGAGRWGGGGGGGGVVVQTVDLPPGHYNVVVGEGGAGGWRVNGSSTHGSRGGDSSFMGTVVALGGGGGMTTLPHSPAVNNGGSGGGGATFSNTTHANGTPGQGFDGGKCYSLSSMHVGGGGGGAGERGGDGGSLRAGYGGRGRRLRDYWPVGRVWFGGGGGGGQHAPLTGRGMGGAGGGGDGGDVRELAALSHGHRGGDGAPGSGGGGGGATSFGQSGGEGGRGGSGVVVLRYALRPSAPPLRCLSLRQHPFRASPIVRVRKVNDGVECDAWGTWQGDDLLCEDEEDGRRFHFSDVLDFAASGVSTSNFTGAVSDGRYIYALPGWNNIPAVVVRVDTRDRSVTSLDISAVGTAHRLFRGGCIVGRHLYVGSDTSTLIVKRVDLDNFTYSGVQQVVASHPTANALHWGVADGRWVYFTPHHDSGTVVARLDTTNFSPSGFTFLDISLIAPGAGGCIGAFVAGGYLYCVPYGAPAHGKLVRVKTSSFSAADGQVLDLATIHPSLVGFANGCVLGRYAYLPSFANRVLARVRLDLFSAAGVEYIDLQTSAGLSCATTDGRYVYVGSMTGGGPMWRIDPRRFSFDHVRPLGVAVAGHYSIACVDDRLWAPANTDSVGWMMVVDISPTASAPRRKRLLPPPPPSSSSRRRFQYLGRVPFGAGGANLLTDGTYLYNVSGGSVHRINAFSPLASPRATALPQDASWATICGDWLYAFMDGSKAVYRMSLCGSGGVETFLSTWVSSAVNFWGLITHGRYIVAVPHTNKTVALRVDTVTRRVDELDLSAVPGVRGGFAEGCVDDRGRAYLVPHHDTSYHGVMVRLDVYDFTPKTVEIMDLTQIHRTLRGMYGALYLNGFVYASSNLNIGGANVTCRIPVDAFGDVTKVETIDLGEPHREMRIPTTDGRYVYIGAVSSSSVIRIDPLDYNLRSVRFLPVHTDPSSFPSRQPVVISSRLYIYSSSDADVTIIDIGDDAQGEGEEEDEEQGAAPSPSRRRLSRM